MAPNIEYLLWADIMSKLVYEYQRIMNISNVHGKLSRFYECLQFQNPGVSYELSNTFF